MNGAGLHGVPDRRNRIEHLPASSVRIWRRREKVGIEVYGLVATIRFIRFGGQPHG